MYEGEGRGPRREKDGKNSLLEREEADPTPSLKKGGSRGWERKDPPCPLPTREGAQTGIKGGGRRSTIRTLTSKEKKKEKREC